MEKLMRKPAEAPAGKTKNRWKKWVILLVVLVLLAAAAVFFMGRGGRRNADPDAAYQETAAAVRNITNSLTGSGTLQPANSYTVTTLVSGEILADTFEEGDTVEEDALLYIIDSSDASSSQTQAQKNYQNAVKSKYPTADVSGTVSAVYVQNGESVSAGTKLCDIMSSSDITADFQFAYADSSAFYEGQPATIYFNGYEGTAAGTVQQVSQSGVANATGRVMTTVRVKLENPGLVSGDITAKASIGTYNSYEWTKLHVGTTASVTASAGGRVTGMNWLPGDTIRSGDRICTITGDSVDDQIESALNSLENAQDRLDDYQVKSPIAGTVIEKYAKAGDNAGTGSSGGSTLCIIYDLSYLEMTLNIDELDIRTVEVGQPVQITANAAEGQVYTGEVTKVSIVGTTSGGITTYPVTVRIDEYDGLLPGMNVDAEITLSSVENVLAIPNGALNRGDTVLITKDSPSAVNALEQEAPEGYVYVAVTTGLSDDSYIEITGGLQEGDTVAYLRSASGNMMMGMMPGGMMPMGGMGARPSGMPSGGMGARPSGMGGGFPG